jgi:hypothetical protein
MCGFIELLLPDVMLRCKKEQRITYWYLYHVCRPKKSAMRARRSGKPEINRLKIGGYLPAIVV